MALSVLMPKDRGGPEEVGADRHRRTGRNGRYTLPADVGIDRLVLANAGENVERNREPKRLRQHRALWGVSSRATAPS